MYKFATALISCAAAVSLERQLAKLHAVKGTNKLMVEMKGDPKKPDLIFSDEVNNLCVMSNISFEKGRSTWSATKCDAWNLREGEIVKFSVDYNGETPKKAIRTYTRVGGDRLCIAIIDPEACHRD